MNERNNIKDIIEVRRDIHEPNIVMDLYKKSPREND